MVGRYHDARACTFDGRSCWIAYLERDWRTVVETLKEFSTEAEAIAYLADELRARRVDVLDIRRSRAAGDEPTADYHTNRAPSARTEAPTRAGKASL